MNKGIAMLNDYYFQHEYPKLYIPQSKDNSTSDICKMGEYIKKGSFNSSINYTKG